MTDENMISNILRFPVVLSSPLQDRAILSWRGLLLQSPPALQAIEPRKRLEITDLWFERGKLYLEFSQTANAGNRSCYTLDEIVEQDSQIYLAISLAPGWPGSGGEFRVIVKLIDQRAILTIDEEELLSVKAAFDHAGPPSGRMLENYFGAFARDEGLYRRMQMRQRIEEEQLENRIASLCMACDHPVADEDYCPNCGSGRAAPKCTACNEPVVSYLNKKLFLSDENGEYPWHFGWNGRCEHCGLSFDRSSIKLRTGHTKFFVCSNEERLALCSQKSAINDDPFEGDSSISISMGESVYVGMDCWDHQPTVLVKIRRLVAANKESDGSLTQEAEICLTPEECRALCELLNGYAKVLLQRKKYFRDTT